MDKRTAYGLGVALGNWARTHKVANIPEVVIGMDTVRADRGLPSIWLEG